MLDRFVQMNWTSLVLSVAGGDFAGSVRCASDLAITTFTTIRTFKRERKRTKSMRILFTGGGTGGHIFPIIATARELKKVYRNDLRLLYVGPADLATEFLKKENIPCKVILAGKMRRYFSFFNLIDIFKIPIGFIQSLWHVFLFMPDVIFGKGGYGSIPVAIVGWIYNIPIIIHESDAAAGFGNRILAPFAKKVIVAFEETKKDFPSKEVNILGNPIREEILTGNREEGKRMFGIVLEKPVILILGGSQGAQKINEVVLNTLPRLLEKCEIIHLCGKRNLKSAEAEGRRLLSGPNADKAKFYHLFPFLEEDKLKHAYALTDLIVSRAGSGSIFEIAAAGKPSILIPLVGAAKDHQRKNAYAFAKSGGTVVLEEPNLTINMFLSTVFRLLDNPEELKKMGEQAKSFYKPEVNRKIAEEIIKQVTGSE